MKYSHHIKKVRVLSCLPTWIMFALKAHRWLATCTTSCLNVFTWAKTLCIVRFSHRVLISTHITHCCKRICFYKKKKSCNGGLVRVFFLIRSLQNYIKSEFRINALGVSSWLAVKYNSQCFWTCKISIWQGFFNTLIYYLVYDERIWWVQILLQMFYRGFFLCLCFSFIVFAE